MDPKDNKPSTPSRRTKKEDSDFLEADDCRTAVETESLTDARISRVPPPVTASPRDAWAHVAPTSQPRIVPATRLSQADRDAQEIATSTQRALDTLRSSSDPRDRLFVSPHSSAASKTTPKPAAKSPFRPFSGHGRPLMSPYKANNSVRTAVSGASPLQSSVRTARSPDVRTGLENSGRSARLREARSESAASSSKSGVRTAIGATPKKSRSRSKSGCKTVHTATANYEIDLRQRSNSVTGPTTNVSTARTISPAKPGRRTPVRPANNSVPSYFDPDYAPLPSEGDPEEQRVELVDKSRLSQEYTPHISRPILFGTSGVNTARAHSPVRNRTLSERTAVGDTSLRTSKTCSPASKSQKSVRTARAARGQSPANTLGSYNHPTSRSLKSEKSVRTGRAARGQSPANTLGSYNHPTSRSQSSLSTTSARSFNSAMSWATAGPDKSLRSAHKSASATPALTSARSGNFSTDSSASRGLRTGKRKTAASKPTTSPMRTAAMHSSRSPAELTAISPDVRSSKRSPPRTARGAIRPDTPDTPRGWPYRASEQIQMKQTSIRIAPSSTSLKTAAAASPRKLKSAKSPALRSQKELHREAKSGSSNSRRSINPTSNVSTARTIATRNGSAAKSSKSAALSPDVRTLSPQTLKAAKKKENDVIAATSDGPDLVIETVQAHGNIEIDLCFNFRVRAAPGHGFGESSSPLKPKEVLINGQPIWRKE